MAHRGWAGKFSPHLKLVNRAQSCRGARLGRAVTPVTRRTHGPARHGAGGRGIILAVPSREKYPGQNARMVIAIIARQ